MAFLNLKTYLKTYVWIWHWVLLIKLVNEAVFVQFKSEANRATKSGIDSLLFQAANSFASLLQKSKIQVLSIQGVYDLFVDARVPLNEIEVCIELFSVFFFFPIHLKYKIFSLISVKLLK